jgi:hypothetical protein
VLTGLVNPVNVFQYGGIPEFIKLYKHGRISLRSRRYSRARENGKLEIPPAQKLHILSSPAAECRSILIRQNVDFEFLIDRSKELE